MTARKVRTTCQPINAGGPLPLAIAYAYAGSFLTWSFTGAWRAPRADS